MTAPGCLAVPLTLVALLFPTDPASPTLAAAALGHAPRVRLDQGRGLLWADARSLDAAAVAARLVALARRASAGGGEAAKEEAGPGGGEAGIAAGQDCGPVATPRAGVAGTPVAALAAARRAPPGGVHHVPPGTDRVFLAPLDLDQLDPPPPPALFPLLAAVGIRCCGDLARLDREAVEVRFGAEGTRLWRLARADDPRPMFGPPPAGLPAAALEWVDYALDRQEQVLFIIHSLLGPVCDALAARGQGAHAMTLEFTLADRAVVTHPARSSAPSAARAHWLRLLRTVLAPVTFGAPVARIALQVAGAAPLPGRQGDLFDRGFATGRATEAALVQLLDRQADALVTAERTRHPLPERRVAWRALGPEAPAAGRRAAPAPPRLTLQLAAEPRPVAVRLASRRGREVPASYRDGAVVHPLAEILGPDRVAPAGGAGREREYFQGVRADGTVVLLVRDPGGDRWFLGGWWD